jgi:alpha-tubulin suppressor-like RCC1 family protein
MRAHILLAALFVSACVPEIPEGRAACSADGECPSTWVCRREDRGGRCWRTASGIDAGPEQDGGVHDAATFDAGVPVDAARSDTGDDAGPANDASGCTRAADCNDAIACTLDVCDIPSGTCSHTAPDGDHDTHPALCTDASGAMIGDDCDDTRASVFPGAPEICNTDRDDDCDGHGESTDTDVACPWNFCSDATHCDAPQRLAVGDGHTCVLTTTGRLWCWGRNDHGQVGIGSSGASVTTPTLITAVTMGATDVAAGAAHTCALEARGVVCWGSNGDGQVGDGMMSVDRLVPFVVPGSIAWTSITAGDRHNCSYDGTTLRCWGANERGQLGVGDTNVHLSVMTVSGTPIMRPAATGGRHSCYRTTAGGVMCWGHNGAGQIGDATMNNNAVLPTAAMLPMSDATTMGLGDAHTCVWRNSANRFMCWGANARGQLGNASTTDSNVPVLVSNTTGLNPTTATAGISVTAGDEHTCALDASSHVYCWGANDWGQLATGDRVMHTQPISSVLAPPVSVLNSGAFHTCAIAGNDVWCWGHNTDGQVGNGALTDVLTPVIVTPP